MVKKILLVIPVLFLFITACETQGDKFPSLEVKETSLGTIPGYHINKAFFINKQTGFAAITRDTILKTTDGWKTFACILVDNAATYKGIEFLNENVGFVIDSNNYVFKTIDGGSNWEKLKIDIPGAYLQDIICLNQDTLFLAAGSDRQSAGGYIIRSLDGGKTWDTTRTINLSHITFVNDSEGFAGGDDGIMKTTDSGRTWDTISTLSSEDILFIDENTGYSSVKRSLYKTMDGGMNWSLLKTIITPHWFIGEDFSKIECLNRINKKDLIFTLNARLIMVTSDQKWFQYRFTKPYYQVQMISPDRGIVFGFENLILVDF